MAPIPERASVVVGTFDPAQVFPSGDLLTVPLLRLMLATGDLRRARLFCITVNQQVDQTTGIQQTFHGGQLWYGFRLVCSHLKEGGDALNTLLNRVPERRLADLLRGRPEATEALGRLRSAFGKDTFISKVRNWVGAHYQQADIKRVFEHDLANGRLDATVAACEVGGLSWFPITDVLALRLMDVATGADLTAEGAQFAKHGEEAMVVADDLSTLVDHLVSALLKQHGAQVTHDTIEVPALLRAAREAVENTQESPTP